MTVQHLLYECNIVKCQRWFHWWMKKLWRIVFLKVWPLNARRPGKKSVFGVKSKTTMYTFFMINEQHVVYWYEVLMYNFP